MKVSFLVEAPLPRGARTRLRGTLDRLVAELGVEQREMGILFTNDAGIRAYNARWRKKDRATDVLSFQGEGDYLGDLVVSLERAQAQADEAGHDLVDEVEILLLHGVLHLLGHDHETDGGQMRRLERRVAGRVLGRKALIERAGGGTRR